MYFTGPSIRRSNGRGLNRHLPRNYLTWDMPPDANAAVDAVYRSEWGRIVATLIRLVRDFDVAEEAAQEAFSVAVDQWRDPPVPPIPRRPALPYERRKGPRPHPPHTRAGGGHGPHTPAGAGPTRLGPQVRPGALPP